MNNYKSKEGFIIPLIIFGALVVIGIWFIQVVFPIQNEQTENRAVVQDDLAELTLNNLRAQAEIYAFSNFPTSYEGFCNSLERELAGLENVSCEDSEKTFAVDAQSGGKDSVICVDNLNGVTSGLISEASGVCANGNIQNVKISAMSKERKLEIQKTIAGAMSAVNVTATEYSGITIKSLKPLTVEKQAIFPVLLVSGNAVSRTELMSFFYDLKTTSPLLKPELPVGQLNQASNIDFALTVTIVEK